MMQYGQANPFGQPNNVAAGYGGYAQPMYNMGMMPSPYGAGYPQAYGNPAAAAYGAGGMAPDASRTIYLGNVKPEIQPHEILRFVHTGLVESYRHCTDKSCAFLSFVDPNSAQAFHNEFMSKKLVVGDTEIKVGWGKSNPLSNVLKAQVQSGATRTVYIGRITESDTEETIRSALIKYGPIENVKIMREKNIAFVYFLSISVATQCVNNASKDPEWAGKKINYGKDHCAPQQLDYNSAFAMQSSPYGAQAAAPFNPYGYPDMSAAGPMAPTNRVLRTLYIGNIHPDAKVEDVCNTIRGGILVQVRYLSDKNIAFVTFTDAATALNVYNHAQSVGLVLRGRRLRVGWGKPSSISPEVSAAILRGATRNIYVGGIPETLTEEKLKADFSEYGEIELVNTFREKKCAFVNFTTIHSAMAAIEGMRLKLEYNDFKLNFGKDRCGNPFKPAKAKKDESAPAPATTTAAAAPAAAATKTPAVPIPAKKLKHVNTPTSYGFTFNQIKPL